MSSLIERITLLFVIVKQANIERGGLSSPVIKSTAALQCHTNVVQCIGDKLVWRLDQESGFLCRVSYLTGNQ